MEVIGHQKKNIMNQQLAIILSILFLVLCSPLYGQVPQSMNYQAVVRDDNLVPLNDQSVAIRASILRESPTGDAVYIEEHFVTSNGFGLINMQIGKGSIVFGNFANIDWGNDEFHLQIELDPAGGNNYLLMGVNQLISVPYALHAQTASNINDADADPGNELVTGVLVQGDTLYLQEGPNQIPIDLSPFRQTLAYNTNTNELSISQGNTVIIDASVGPPGPQGPKGDTGAQGPPGPQGSQGAQGNPGSQGPPGVQGPQGVAGASVKVIGSVANVSQLPTNYGGDIGDMFITQEDGHGHVWNGTSFDDIGEIKGPKGDQGATGPQGPQGAQGDQGLPGPQGPQGMQGEKGDKGDQGDPGPQGIKGDQGDPGIQGPKGDQGDPGVQGPKGDKGDQGDQGPMGLQGPKGDQGDVGPEGPQGMKGEQGDQGPMGLQGPQGPKGDKGDQGSMGLQGPKGDQGDTGPQGPQGPPGPVQTLTKMGDQIILSDGGGSVTDEVNDLDSDPVNEIQTLALNGDILSISSGNSISLSGLSPWQTFSNGIYYNLGETWVGSTGSAPGLRMTQSGMNVFGPNNTSSLFDNELRIEESGVLRTKLSSGLLELFDGTGQYNAAIGGYPGWVGTYFDGNSISSMGMNASNSGAIGLYNPSGTLNVNISSVVGSPNTGILDVNFNGNTRARMSASGDDAGYFYAYGSGNSINTYSGYVSGYPNIGTFYAYQNGNLRSVLSSNFDDVGELITYGPAFENVRITNPSGFPDAGKISVFNNGKPSSVISLDANNDAGAIATYNPSEGLNVLLSTFAPSNSDYGAIRIFGNDEEKVALYAEDNDTGAMEVLGSGGETNVRISATFTEPNTGKIEVYRDDDPVVEIGSTPLAEAGIIEILKDYDEKVTLRVTDDGAGAFYSKGPVGNNIVEIIPPTGYPDAGGMGIYGPGGTLNTSLGISLNDPNVGTISTFRNDQIISFIGDNPGSAGTFSTYATNGEIKTLTSTSTLNEAGTFTTFYNNMEIIDLTTSMANGGYITTYLNQIPMTHLTHNGAGAGGLWLSNSNYYYDAVLTSNNDPNNTGGVLQLFKNGNEKMLLEGSSNVGILQTKGAAGQLNTFISHQGGDQNGGTVATYHTGAIRTALIGDQAAGVIRTFDSNLLYNVDITALGSDTDHGYISVNDFNGFPQAGAYVDAGGQGIVWGDTKNFRMQHPEQAGKEIWYASIEGPEAAAYVRGTATLINGKVSVEFPEHFQLVANAATMTVMMTPLSPESKGLCVVEKTQNGFTVQELWKGEGNYDFDWEVKCIRKGYENYRVIRDETEAAAALAPMPTKVESRGGGLPERVGRSYFPNGKGKN